MNLNLSSIGKIVLLSIGSWIIISCAGSSRVTEQTQGNLFWPPPPENPRIKWLEQWSNRHDFGRPSQILTFLVGAESVEWLRRPNGVVADSSGNIYVADSEYHIIFVFNKQKNTLQFLGEGTVATPIGLALDNKRGVLYVSDSKLERVFGLDKNSGNVIVSIGGIGEMKNPSGLVYDEERERLYVSDTQKHVVKVFDKSGKLLFTIGKQGQENGEFSYPSYLALDRKGNLYVVDTFNFRIQIFDPEGKFIKKFGKLGDTSGRLSRPAGIGVDSDGNIYVADSAFSNFQIFNDEGKLLMWVGNGGTKRGEFALPSGMYIDKEDRIYVSDTFNRRVQVFQYLKEKK